MVSLPESNRIYDLEPLNNVMMLIMLAIYVKINYVDVDISVCNKQNFIQNRVHSNRSNRNISNKSSL